MVARSDGTPSRKSSSRTGYYQALMNPKTGPLVGIPTFVPIETQRQRVRAVGSVSTNNGQITINVNARRMVANNASCIRYAMVDGMTDSTAHTVLNNNAEHGTGDFGDGSDLKARVVAMKVTLKNTSSLNDRNGMFYALQERHHHNMAGQTSSTMASDASCIIQSATDGDITLLYRPVQPREVEDWQHNAYAYPDELFSGTAGTGDDGPLDQNPGFMQIIWKGEGAQAFFLEVDAIIEYAGEIKDSISNEPHLGAPPGCTPAQPRDIPHVVKEVELAEKHPEHHKSIVKSIENAAIKGLKWLGHQADPTSSAGKRNWKTAGGYAISALSKYGKYKKGSYKRGRY